MAPGAARRARGRRAHGHLRVRRRALRDAHRQEGVRREDAREPDRRDPRARAAADPRRAAAHATGARPCREDVPGEGSGRAVAKRERPDARAEVDCGNGAAGRCLSTAAASAVRPGRRERIVAWTLAAVCAAAAIALGMPYLRRAPATDAPPMRFAVAPPQNVTLSGANGQSMPAVSPDGRRLAFVATRAGTQLLWVRSLDALEAQPLPGTEGALAPSGRPTAAPSGSSSGTCSRPSTPPADRCARSATCPAPALAGARGAPTA